MPSEDIFDNQNTKSTNESDQGDSAILRQIKTKQEKLREYQKNYRLNNADRIREYRHQYYLDNIDKANMKIECECGGFYTFSNKSSHFKTKLHRNYEKQTFQSSSS